MENLKHTPGPWMYSLTGEVMRGYSQSYAVAQYNQLNLVAGIFSDVAGGDPVAKANAKLIACAPEMLFQLEQAKVILEVIDGENPAIKQIESVIKKATE